MTATVGAPSRHRRIRIALIVIAAIESLGALRDIPAIFYDFNPTTPLGKFAQALGSVDHVVAVLLAFAALCFALASRLRLAIAAVAMRILVTWLCDLPSNRNPWDRMVADPLAAFRSPATKSARR